MDYYSFPLKMDRLMEGRQMEKLEIRKSIHQNIRLILNSFPLSYRYDPSFGCILNKYHAQTPPQKGSKRVWQEELRESIQKNLKDLLSRYETRITIQDVIVDMQDSGQKSGKPVVNVKVEVTGNLAFGRKENFYFPDSEVTEEGRALFPLVIPVGR